MSCKLTPKRIFEIRSSRVHIIPFFPCRCRRDDLISDILSGINLHDFPWLWNGTADVLLTLKQLNGQVPADVLAIVHLLKNLNRRPDRQDMSLSSGVIVLLDLFL